MPIGRFQAPDILLVNSKTALDAPPNNNVTLTWSEAQSETFGGVSITTSKYLIYKTDSSATPLYETPVATLKYTGTRSYTIAGPTNIGDTAYYWVALQAPDDYGGAKYFNTTPVTVTAVNVQPNSSPTLSISNTTVIAGAPVTLSWTASTPGENSVIARYNIRRKLNANGDWEWIARLDPSILSYQTNAPTTTGDSYTYRVYAVGEWSESLSSSSNAVSVLANTPPTAPTIVSGSSGKTYNRKPRILITLGTDIDTMSVSANKYTASRATGITSGQNVDLYRTANVSAATHTETITVTDVYGESVTASATYTVGSVTWTDDPVVAGTTLIKAAHIMELRTVLDDICDYYGLAHTTWGDDVIAGETSSALFPQHAEQLQNTVKRIAQYINGFDPYSTVNNVVLPSFTDPSAVRAAVINELRQAVILL